MRPLLGKVKKERIGLTIDPEIIRLGMTLAKSRGLSLSSMIEGLLKKQTEKFSKGYRK